MHLDFTAEIYLSNQISGTFTQEQMGGELGELCIVAGRRNCEFSPGILGVRVEENGVGTGKEQIISSLFY